MRTMQRIQSYILSGNRRLDYIALCAVGLVPIVISLIIGAAYDVAIVYRSASLVPPAPKIQSILVKGYLAAEDFNWWLTPLILPASLYILRLACKRTLNPENHPLVTHFKDETDRVFMESQLQGIIHGFKILSFALLMNIVIHMVDMREVIHHFFSSDGDSFLDADWSNFFIAGTVTKASVIPLVVSAYIGQFLIGLLGLMMLGMFFQYNVLFVRSIYLRSRASQKNEPTFVLLNFSDPQKHLGLTEIHTTFDFQIGFLIVVGFIILVSRFAHAQIDPGLLIPELLKAIKALWEQKFEEMKLIELLKIAFPTVGQIILLVLWSVLLGIVAIPALVKFLPLTCWKNWNRPRDYLEEFLPLNAQQNETAKTVEDLMASFCANSFWPGGDPQASRLFSFSFVVFLLILFPLNLRSASGWIAVVLMLVVGSLISSGILLVLQWSLYTFGIGVEKRKEK